MSEGEEQRNQSSGADVQLPLEIPQESMLHLLGAKMLVVPQEDGESIPKFGVKWNWNRLKTKAEDSTCLDSRGIEVLLAEDVRMQPEQRLAGAG